MMHFLLKSNAVSIFSNLFTTYSHSLMIQNNLSSLFSFKCNGSEVIVLSSNDTAW